MEEHLQQLKHHTIVIVAYRRDRGIVLQNLLAKFGFKIVITLSLYDALQYISQQMPHLVLTDAILTDGNAATLFDRLSQHAALQRIPVLVNIINKSNEELTILRQKKFAGAVAGAAQPRALVEKILTTLSAYAAVSPYAFDLDSTQLPRATQISIDASVVGVTENQLVVKSGMEIDNHASLVCMPNDRKYDPAVLRMASNLKKGSQIFNLFPINRVLGKGRSWIQKLPTINGDLSGNAAPKDGVKRVIFYDPNEERFLQFRDILLGYGIDLIYAVSLQRSIAILRQRHADIACMYLHELLNDASGIEWRKQFATLPVVHRPPIIIGTGAIAARSTPGIRFIRRPFGLGVLVNTLQASFERADQVTEGIETNGYTGLAARYQAPAEIVALDEVGGMLEVKFPIVEGGRLKIHHDFLQKVWDDSVVTITGVSVNKAKVDTWWVRFQAVDTSASKTKYWLKMASALSDLQNKAKKQSA